MRDWMVRPTRFEPFQTVERSWRYTILSFALSLVFDPWVHKKGGLGPRRRALIFFGW